MEPHPEKAANHASLQSCHSDNEEMDTKARSAADGLAANGDEAAATPSTDAKMAPEAQAGEKSEKNQMVGSPGTSTAILDPKTGDKELQGWELQGCQEAATIDQYANDIQPMPTSARPDPSIPGAFAVLTPRVDMSNWAADSSPEAEPPTSTLDNFVDNGALPQSDFLVNAVLSPGEDGGDETLDGQGNNCETTSRASHPEGTSVSHEFSEQDPESNDRELDMVLDAKIVEEEGDLPSRPLRRQRILFSVVVIVLLAIAVVMALGLSGTFHAKQQQQQQQQQQPDPAVKISEVAPNLTRFDRIRERGYLSCLYFPIAGFLYTDSDTGEISGFNSVWCKAIAAALFGPEDIHTKLKYLTFSPTVIEQMDISPLGTTPTMTRNFPNSNMLAKPLYFTAPFFYDGLRVAGDPFFVECFENDFHHVGECADLMLCVFNRSTFATFAASVLPQRRILSVATPRQTTRHFVAGDCNIFLIKQEKASLSKLREMGYEGNYTLGTKMLATEPWSTVVHTGDPIWCDFVNMVTQSLFVAEQYNITRATAHRIPTSNVFGEDLKYAFRHAVEAVGSYGEAYEKYLEATIPRHNVNRVNDGVTGLMISLPFGNLEPREEDPILSPNMQRVLSQGKLVCGVQPGKPRLAMKEPVNGTITGMDAAFCQALAAGLVGDGSALELVELTGPSDGYQKLVTREVDVVAGAIWNLENDVREPATGVGFAFSQPYYYGLGNENACLATLQDDTDWVNYVFWVVSATIYAEEQNITDVTHNDMPHIHVFGSALQRVFRDAILEVGNYGQIYERNMEAIEPREGRNLLNESPFGPQIYPIPGMV